MAIILMYSNSLELLGKSSLIIERTKFKIDDQNKDFQLILLQGVNNYSKLANKAISDTCEKNIFEILEENDVILLHPELLNDINLNNNLSGLEPGKVNNIKNFIEWSGLKGDSEFLVSFGVHMKSFF